VSHSAKRRTVLLTQ